MSSLLTMYSLLVSHCMCLDRCYLCELLQPLWPSGFVLTALQLPLSCSHFPSGELQLSLWTPHPFRFVENTVWILWIPVQCPHQRELLLWHIFFALKCHVPVEIFLCDAGRRAVDAHTKGIVSQGLELWHSAHLRGAWGQLAREKMCVPLCTSFFF